MNTVALPASASGSALGAEGELVRQAAAGKAEAFGELYRRHSESAWRLAQAVASDRDRASRAVADGFARALRAQRRRRALAGDTSFRNAVLAAVYRTAIDQPREHAAAARTPTAIEPQTRTKSKRTTSKAADTALVNAAFRSLPERWRAAVWLSEVESMPEDRIATILGVSLAVASQLVIRANRGLAGRFAQAHRETPDHLGSTLRPVALAVPTNLSYLTERRWSAAVSDPRDHLAPITGWLGDHAVRPLWVAVSGVMGLGLIAIPLVGDVATVNTGAGTGHNNGGKPIPVSQSGTNPEVPSGFHLTTGPATGATGATGGTLASATGGLTTASGQSPTGSVGGHNPGGTTGTGPTGPPPPPPPTATTKTVLNLGPVASVTETGKALQVNLLPTKTGSTATVGVGGKAGLDIKIGKINLKLGSLTSGL